jgi:hypothetical protein
MAGNQTANFVVKAKDQASGPLGKIGTSMGKLRSNGITALKGIAVASLAAATALAAFAAGAIKAAMDDERQTILLNAALRQRGFNTEALNKAIREQITSMGALGIADDQVRAGLEIGSRFFKDQETLLKANAIAADIAAVTGTDLAEVMMTIGKGAQGQTRGLKALGIEVKKGATVQDILTAASEKYSGIAAEIANSTSGKLATSQVRFNEAIENLGYKLLPEVNKVLDWLTTTGLPAFEKFIADISPVYQAFIDEAINPLINAFDRLGKMLGEDVPIFAKTAELALTPLKLLIQALTFGLDRLADAGQFFGLGREGTGVSTNPMNDKYAGVVSPMSSKYGGGSPTVVTNVNIGTKKVDTVVNDSMLRLGLGFPPPRQ